MKKHNIIISALLIVVAITGCEDFKFGNAFLEKPISDDINIDTVFAHKKYADQLLNQIYRTLPDYLPLEAKGYRGNWIILDGPTDICYHSGSAYASSSVSADYDIAFPYVLFSSTQHIGNPLYGIRKAFIYQENIDRVPDMTSEEKKIRKAETKVIVALHYSYMLRHYGGVPWIDHAYRPDDEFEFPRLTVEETVNRIVMMLDEAATDLPWYTTDAENGHMTAAAAKALKLRVLLFAASPLLNNDTPYYPGEAADLKLSWYGDYKQERWQAALDAGLEFLRMNRDNGEYYCIIDTDNPREDYVNGYWVRGSHEIIMESHRWAVYNLGVKSIDRGHNDNYNQVRGSYADMFQWKDGSNFDWENPEHKAHPFFDENMKPTRDIRLYETLVINEDKYQNQPNGAECYAGGRQSKDASKFTKAIYGYSVRKFIRDRKEEISNKPYQCPLIRMPEVYLSIAEAMNQMGKAGVKDEFGRDAYDYINLVRDRAGLPGVERVEGQELTDIILHERAVEFGAEDVRYADLIRYKRKDLLSTPVSTLTITKTGTDNDGRGIFRYETNVTGEHYDWQDHWYLIAFPTDEINKKYGLIQNPGW